MEIENERLCCVVVECFDVSSFFRSFDVLQVTIPCTSTFEVMRFVGFCRLPPLLEHGQNISHLPSIRQHQKTGKLANKQVEDHESCT